MLRLRNLIRTTQLAFRVSPPLSQPVGPVNVRRVKFQRPWLRRLVTSCLLYGAAFHIWSSFVFVEYDDDDDTSQEPENESNIQHYHNHQHIERNDEDEGDFNKDQRLGGLDAERTTFIPLSWPLLREGDYYAGSDPEWQEFVRISKDAQKIGKLKDELTGIVMKNASQSTRLSAMLGDPLKLSTRWLMCDFPFRAPPQFGCVGLFIGDNSIALGLKSMDTDEGNALRRFLQPVYMSLAVRDAFVVMMKRQLSRVRSKSADNGTKTDNPFYPHELPADLGKLESLNYLPDHDPQSPLSASSNSQADEAPQDQDQDDSSSHPHQSSTSSLIPNLKRFLLPGLGPGSDFHLALRAFQWRLNDCWARESPVPRRGSFYVSGPVGIRGSKGWCRVDVKGEYHPATASWSRVSMQLKELGQFRQGPLGGRSGTP